MASTVEEQLSVEMRKTMALALVIKNGWTGTIAPPREDVNLGKFVECAGLALFEAKKRQAMRMTQNSPYVIFVQYLGLTTAVPSDGGATILGLKQSIMNSLQIYYGVHPDKYLLFFYVSEGVFLKNNLKRVSSSFGDFAEICVIEKGEFGRVLMGEQPRGLQVDVESLVNASRDDEARAKAKAKAKAKAMAVAESSSDSDTAPNAVAGATPAPVADAVGDTPPAPVAAEATGDAVDNVSTDVWMKVFQVVRSTTQLLVNCDNPLQDENVKLLRMSVSSLNGYLTVNVFYHKNAGCDDLMRVISNAYDIDREAFCLKFRSGSVLQPFDGLDAYNTEGEVFKLTPKVLGGGVRGVIKKHLKPDEAKKLLKDRLNQFLPEKVGVAEQDIPEEVKAFQVKMTHTVSEIQMLQARLGNQFVKTMLRQLSSETLDTVGEALKYGVTKRHRHGEERLLSVMTLLFPNINQIDIASNALMDTKREMLQTLMECFIECYGNYKDGAMTYNISQFADDVRVEKLKRDERGSNSSASTEAPALCSLS
eukprot:symbB.v1.2.041439.t1/scaffold8206.1/size7308/1